MLVLWCLFNPIVKMETNRNTQTQAHIPTHIPAIQLELELKFPTRLKLQLKLFLERASLLQYNKHTHRDLLGKKQ